MRIAYAEGDTTLQQFQVDKTFNSYEKRYFERRYL